MATLDLALPTVFLHEGRYVDHPGDPGGKTNWGISLRFLLSTGDLDHDGLLDCDFDGDGKLTAEDIKLMTQEDAAHIYDMYFWTKNGYGKIEDQVIATKLFDLSVNMGSKQAHTIIQRSLRSTNPAIKITEDGVLGVNSFREINMANPQKLLPAIKSEAAGFYRMLALRKEAFRAFLNGWLNRAYSNCVTFPSMNR